MSSRFFIERPIFAWVIALFVLVIGAAAIRTLPVAQYPSVAPPSIVISAIYPGASAKVMEDSVLAVIEQEMNGAPGMIYMESGADANGSGTITVTFEPGSDVSIAQIEVQNRLSRATPRLPSSVVQQGVRVDKARSNFLLFVMMTSTRADLDPTALGDYAARNIIPELLRVPGVGQATLFGTERAMRVWVDPQKLQGFGLGPLDVNRAIAAQNAQVSAGSLGGLPNPDDQTMFATVTVNGQLGTVEQFGNIVLRANTDGSAVHLRDVARIELGAQAYSTYARLNGIAATGIGVQLAPTGNALATGDAIKERLKELQGYMPQGMSYDIPFDSTRFIKISIQQVVETLVEAIFLVFLVMLLFLQNIRYTLIPTIVVPVALLGTFTMMKLFGFSINVLTLFGMVLAIGILVDDAIVVVEGASKHIERGLSPRDAAIAAMGELFGPIVAVTLVLMAVFLPAAFLPGIIGQMYRQFALVIAVTALLSGINAMTLKPTQCALWLRAVDPNRKKNAFFRAFNAIYEPLENWYAGLINRMVHHSGLMTVIALVLVGLSLVGLFRTPTGFLPTEDQGYVVVAVQLPNGAALGRSQAAMRSLAEVIRKVPGVAETIVIGGNGSSPIDASSSLFNSGVIYAVLKPSKERGREEDLAAINRNLLKAVATIQDANCLVMLPPPIQGLGISDGFQMQVELSNGTFDYARLESVTQAIVAEANKQPSITGALTPFRADVPQLSLKLNRSEAETYGVQVSDVFNALQTFLGSTYVNQITKFGRTFDVYTQADMLYRLSPDAIKQYTVRNSSGNMVPLGSLISIEPTHGPASISLYNLYPSASIIGSAQKGYSSGQALSAMEKIAHQYLPQGMKYQWTALSYQEKLTGAATVVVFALAMILVYFVLAGQYESWILPLAVIFAIPLAVLGTLTALRITGLPNNLYVQIGLVLLIALSAKNAILVVEMARQRREQGDSILVAAVEGARRRFRPILMTSFTFILGVVPLILATGAGAASRQSLGIAVASGMLASTCLAVVFVPSFFVVLQRWQEGKPPATVPAHEPA